MREYDKNETKTLLIKTTAEERELIKKALKEASERKKEAKRGRMKPSKIEWR